MNKLFTPEDVTICDSLKQGLNDKTASSLGQLNNESLSSLGQLNRTRTAPPKAVQKVKTSEDPERYKRLLPLCHL